MFTLVAERTEELGAKAAAEPARRAAIASFMLILGIEEMKRD
jgi:hypothetical protein